MPKALVYGTGAPVPRVWSNDRDTVTPAGAVVPVEAEGRAVEVLLTGTRLHGCGDVFVAELLSDL
ncbi:hypothetical protein [Streptomyces sp. NPDC058683]|uniref:hypothetical protein n=1 Tax=Streptomyces sp. NPDC058683 TaxID=3346597 RepID=UPI0036632940